MSKLSFDLLAWIGGAEGDDEHATMGSLRITAGEGVNVTEVEDTIAQTVRAHINVPLNLVAEWLLVNWWRLRWEGDLSRRTTSWRRAHCLAAIGRGNAWPPLEISSDGDFVQLRMEAEERADVSAVRYLRGVSVDVPAKDFEAAVERFVDVVESRLSSVLPSHLTISDLRAELADERRRPSVARACRWQALAGHDPGEAPPGWLEAAEALVEETGNAAGEEVMRVLSDLNRGLESAQNIVASMRASTTAVDLTWIQSEATTEFRELPWERGVRLAQKVRHQHKLDTPLSNAGLSEFVSSHLPFQGEPLKERALAGGMRSGALGGRTKIRWTSPLPQSQRFFLARMIATAHVLAPEQHLLPVTNGNSALQKFERSFAQEFLCPWAELNEFTDDRGLDDETLAEAAEHFQVSEQLVRSTLVNRGKLSRARLSTL
jgi:hypothetical protein